MVDEADKDGKVVLAQAGTTARREIRAAVVLDSMVDSLWQQYEGCCVNSHDPSSVVVVVVKAAAVGCR